MATAEKEGFDLIWLRLLRVTGLLIALHQVFIDRFAHPEALLLAGPMMGLASLLKEGG